jgi:hypothetical protein
LSTWNPGEKLGDAAYQILQAPALVIPTFDSKAGITNVPTRPIMTDIPLIKAMKRSERLATDLR